MHLHSEALLNPSNLSEALLNPSNLSVVLLNNPLVAL
jgi:hypothetical protein